MLLHCISLFFVLHSLCISKLNWSSFLCILFDNFLSLCTICIAHCLWKHYSYSPVHRWNCMVKFKVVSLPPSWLNLLVHAEWQTDFHKEPLLSLHTSQLSPSPFSPTLNGTKTLWLYDSNIEYLHEKHIPLFIAALLALLFLLIPYTLVLFFIQCLAKLNCRIFFWVKKLKPLFDAYTGPYKDRYQFWTGFLLIVHTNLFLIFTLGNPGLNLAAISVTSTCLAFSPAVYKKVLLTLLEYSLLLNLSAVSVATIYCRYTQFSGNQVVMVYISVGTALLTFFGIMAYHLYQCTCTINSRPWKNISDRVTQRSSDRELVNIAVEGSDEEEEEEPAQAEIRPLMLQFNEYREPVLVYDD